ncbi:MAG: magnesium/cobalt efflux protein [Flavobacteriaceae bacterium]|nr:magnesium/cobalt efflux protein [Flavobacteriaceae bacterium]
MISVNFLILIFLNNAVDFPFLKIFSLIILLIFSGIISGSEVAFFSLTRNQLVSENKKDQSRLDKIRKLLDKPKRLLATILIANNFINIAIVLLFASLEGLYLGNIENPIIVLIIQVGLITFLIFFFGDILPEIYAIRNVLKFSLFMAHPIFFMDRYLLFFITIPMSRLTGFMESKLDHRGNQFSVDKLSQAFDLTSDDETTVDEQKILKGIVSFGNIETRQIMCPRIDVFAINNKTRINKIIPLILEKGFSRVPVYEESLDQIKGILYIKDLLPHINKKEFDWIKIIKPPFYVTENKKLDDLLMEFKQKKIHLAVVVDEYGGTSGIITLEDVIEEIVGDISDEFDDDNLNYSKLDERTFIFDAKISMNDFYKVIELDDPKEFEETKADSESLAGFLLEVAKEFPEKGQQILFGKYKFIIESANKKGIKTVKINLP